MQRIRSTSFSVVALAAAALIASGPTACGGDDEPSEQTTATHNLPPRPDTAPSLIVAPQDKPRILERIEREPFQSILDRIRENASREHVDLGPDIFDSEEQRNGETALACAFLAWLLDDDAMAEKSRDFMRQLSDNYASKTDVDLDIRMPDVAMGYAFALDLLKGANKIPKDEADELERKLTTLIGAYYEDYVLNAIQRLWSIQLTQNNHPIRTACSIATVALAFPEHPDAERWANWAYSELDHLWGEKGHYVMEDGGVCEGSLYYRFAYAPSLALSLAWRNRVGQPWEFKRDCTNRPNDFHWADHGCVDGDPFTYDNLIDEERFQRTSDWFFALRMPDGQRPPIEDSSPKRDNGAAIMAGILNRPDLLWDWYNDDQNMSGGMDLAIQHLAYLPDVADLPPEPPGWRNRVMPAAGHAVFRSGWEPDAVWTMMIAEHGDSRLTIHDHIDNRSIQLFAYGEYLLIDTGYYKPNMMDNAVTAQEGAHSLLMIQEEPVPPKGLITDYGDTDAFLENEYLGDEVAYVEGRQPIDISTIERGMALWRNRYQVVFDRVETTETQSRHHIWRLHGYAGYDAGGAFTLDAADQHARWEREKAGVDAYVAAVDDEIDAPLSLIEPPYEENARPHVHSLESGVGNHAVLDGLITSVAPVYASVIVPYEVGATSDRGPLAVSRLQLAEPTGGVDGWVVQYDGQTDVVLARSPEAPEQIVLSSGETIETDGCWVVSTVSGDRPMHLMARGTTLLVNSTSIFSGNSGEIAILEPQ